MAFSCILTDLDASAAFGSALAPVLQVGDVIALSGDLGAGRTTITRSILHALGLEGEVASPSFSLVIPYAPPELRLAVAHIDLYRLDDPEDVEELGLDEMRWDSALILEWPERLGTRLWVDALQIRLEVEQNGQRRLTAKVPPSWEGRWPFP